MLKVFTDRLNIIFRMPRKSTTKENGYGQNQFVYGLCRLFLFYLYFFHNSTGFTLSYIGDPGPVTGIGIVAYVQTVARASEGDRNLS